MAREQPAAAAFPLGVVEGFYGRPWSWEARLSMVGFLAGRDYSFYLYAPKSDPFLRGSWQCDWPEEDYARLQELVQECRRQGLAWGVGLCPQGLQRCGAEEQRLLGARLEGINRLEPDILCVLFDDISGAAAGLGTVQVEICHFLMAGCTARQVFFCPSYYSEDARLEQLSGCRPPDYWEVLGARLHPAVEIFWTGPEVINSRYRREDFSAISALLRRKPLLWDNYPVNDGAQSSRYLPLHPFTGRPPLLRRWVSGHVANPMNQPGLSRLPLFSLPAVYRDGGAYDPDALWEEALELLQDAPLAALLRRDVERFASAGLDALEAGVREDLAQEYEGCASCCAREVADWLRGEYAFDPACLTG